MTSPITFHVWGDHALFTRPELKAERVSYDAMTPSAARGILEAVYWKPQMRWLIERIHVLKPVNFTGVCRNELARKIPVTRKRSGGQCIEQARVRRSSLVLRDVAYLIDARPQILDPRFEKNGPPLPLPDCERKHLAIFRRRARAGQCFHRPYFGCREFTAHFALVEDASRRPVCELPPDERNRDLGLMLHDIVYAPGYDFTARFFYARLRDGIIDVPPFDATPTAVSIITTQ